MGRVGRWPSRIRAAATGERIVAFARGGKPPVKPVFSTAGRHFGHESDATEFKAVSPRVFDPGDFLSWL
jgi:hypothetical protein